ncbi:MAG: HAD-IIIA family hydrolase [Proteobacteria bacterium]|nr:HAD-IIIA family hydrolase [Pseudomonadota bacterium]MBU1736792.1 HAD-IIIA family hydrolase [Pseudomonadota bacterium]
MTGNGCGSGGPGYPSDCEVTQGLRERARARESVEKRSYAWKANLERAGRIKMLILDVDGVLTDGSIIYTPDGEEIKAFSTRDGLGIRLVQKAGVEVGIITARSSAVVNRRAENLGITKVIQGAGNKLESFRKIIGENSLDPSQVAYVGDDWLDLPVLTRVGLAVAVADSAPEVIDAAHYVTVNPGGRGAVREVCNLIVEALGKHQELLREYRQDES